MLTILNDPAGITGSSTHDWDYSRTLQDNIAAHLAGGADCELTINGVWVDPLTDARLLQPPSVLDVVIVSRRPGTGLEWWVYALIAVSAAAVTFALMPKIDAAAGAVGKDSPNNRLTAQTNTARAYQATPDVYGSRRIWPDMIQPSTVEYVDNIKYVTEWLCASRGTGDITAVQYADTPLLDIDGASFEVFEPSGAEIYPENNTTTLLDVIETFSSPEVNGQELAYPINHPVITESGALDANTGDAFFTVSILDSVDLDYLKSLAPSGLAHVYFEYGITPDIFGEQCTVLAYSVLAGICTITFSSSAWATTESGTANFVITPEPELGTVGPITLPIACEKIRWNTVFLRGLKGATFNPPFGFDYRVKIKAEWWKVDSGGIEIGGTRENQTNIYEGDTYDQQFFTNEVTPAAGTGRYRIQFSRTSATSHDNGTDIAKLEDVFAVRYYAEKVLPGVTVIRVTTKATDQATGVSERKFNLQFSRHIRTLTSDTLSASRNFARIMAHIWTLAGNDIAELDTDTMAAINAEFGESSPLLRFDASLDDADMSLGERLQLVANHARCIVWRDGQKWTVTRDQARQYPEMQFDYRNLASNGDSAISYANIMPASNDGVQIEYVDPATQAKKSYIRLSIATGAVLSGESANPKKIQLMGCTTLAQAENRAQLEARRLLYQRISVSDKALADANSLGLGALVRWIDPNDFYGDDGLQAGEVLAISGSTLSLSETLNWDGATSGRISFTDAEGARLGAPVVCTPAPAGVVLASVPAGLFVADGATRQCGSRYAFATGLTEAELESAGLYTLTEIKQDGNGIVSLSLAEYDDRIYSED